MKLKINKIFMKEPRIKIRKQKNKDWSWNTNNKEDQTIIFKEGEKKKEKKNHAGGKLPYQQEEDAKVIQMTWWKGTFRFLRVLN
jgi:hypothetical protein